MNELVKKYADELQKIYDERSAGGYTFTGVLGSFAHEAFAEYEKLERKKIGLS